MSTVSSCGTLPALPVLNMAQTAPPPTQPFSFLLMAFAASLARNANISPSPLEPVLYVRIKVCSLETCKPDGFDG